ncbi:MAG: HupE/UreJ family protein [Saprospiraceae bacterium]
MHSEFSIYFQLGIQHIADIKAYDHILFIIALCAIYRPEAWRRILILITAFTIGHSLTLALSALNIIHFPQQVIEFLIPVTILITALLNFKADLHAVRLPLWKYFQPLVFGFIHGMGFSNYFRSLMGKEDSIIKPLFAFNLGIEVGQLGIITLLFVIAFTVIRIFKIPHKIWAYGLSGIAAIMAIYLMYETKFW